MTEDQGFAAWYGDTHARLLASLLFVAGDLETAREAADEAFARALAHWSRVRTMDSPGGWTYRVALNLVRRRQRRAGIERRLLGRHEPRRTPQIPEPAHELWDAVRRLPDRQRVAIVLRYVGDFSEAEVATAMGVARGTVASTLAAARSSLGLVLTDKEPERELEVPHA